MQQINNIFIWYAANQQITKEPRILIIALWISPLTTTSYMFPYFTSAA